jgi:hypothetical protein
MIAYPDGTILLGGGYSSPGYAGSLYSSSDDYSVVQFNINQSATLNKVIASAKPGTTLSRDADVPAFTTHGVRTDAGIVNAPAHHLLIYPNPNNGTFVLQLKFGSAKTGNANIQIINTAGQVVHTESIPVTGYELNKRISFNPSGTGGIYIIAVTVGGESFKGKINCGKVEGPS